MGTSLIQLLGGGSKKHGAVGRGSFEQVMMMGLLQMISLGKRLKEELEHLHDDDDIDKSYLFANQGKFCTPNKPLHPSRVKAMFTNFPRTVLSVQAY